MNKRNIFLAALIMVLVLAGLRISGSDVSASPVSERQSLVTVNPISQDRPNRIAHSSRHDPEAKMARLTTYESITQAYLQGEISAEERLSYLSKIDLPDTKENGIVNDAQTNPPEVAIPNTTDNNRPNQPARPVGDTIIYLPLVLKTPIYGQVTDNGVPVALQEVLLRFYDGSLWSTFATAITDENGIYIFSSSPTLDSDQVYYVRWENIADNTNWLSYWYCNQVTAYSPMSANMCNFDLKNITLSSPAHGTTVNLPQTFSWTTRGFSEDSYELVLFDTLNNNISFETYPPLGNVNSYSLSYRPAGFSTGIAYGWDIGVSTSYGWGESYFYQEVTFSGSAPGPRISGRVTNNGNAASGQTLYLRYYDGINWWTHATTDTDGSGNYSFNNLPMVSVGQVVYVRWDNSAYNNNRLWTWRCNQISVASYIREYTCNFDLKNIPLVSPSDLATVPVPTTFTWTPRGFSGDSYELDIFDPDDNDPLFYTSPLSSSTNSYVLTSLPAGFLPFVQYGWNMYVVTPFDGYGSSYYYYRVTFSNSGSSFAPIIQTLPKQHGWLMEDPLEYPRP